MDYFILSISPNVSEEEVQKLLLSYGAEFLFSTIEESDQTLNIAVLYDGDTDQLSLDISCINDIQRHHYDGINWEDQWKIHCDGYDNGSVELDLDSFLRKKIDAKIKMQSGPGFGDLSHPTTRLVLKLAANRCKYRNVLDIGCGSGILSLAALAFEAHSVIGIDIDPLSIEHSKQNLSLNNFSKSATFGFLEEVKDAISKMKKPLIFINMIRSEQEIAWEHITHIFSHKIEIISSGVRIEEREDYLKEAALKKWTLVEEASEGEWLGFRFIQYI